MFRSLSACDLQKLNEYLRKEECEKKGEGALRWFARTKSLLLECARVLHEGLRSLIVMYGRETAVIGKREDLSLWLYRWITLENVW